MRTYQEWLRDFIHEVIDTSEEGACDFTPEFLYYLVEEVGFSKEQAEKICDAIEESIADEIKKVFEEKGYKAHIHLHHYPYPEIVLEKLC